jgi:hypothetical protein
MGGHALVFCVVFCRSLFVLLSFSFGLCIHSLQSVIPQITPLELWNIGDKTKAILFANLDLDMSSLIHKRSNMLRQQ